MSHDSQDKPTVQPTSIRWVILGLVAFAAASAYLTRYCISAANTTMQEDLGFDNAQMGGLMSAFMLGYFLFQIPGGWLGIRFGTRAAFASIAVCWSLCNAWTAAASLLGMLWASRFMLGVFQAGNDAAEFVAAAVESASACQADVAGANVVCSSSDDSCFKSS